MLLPRFFGGEDMAKARPAEDTRIARMYYIERLPQIEIAEEMEMDRKTISERLRWINRRMKTAWQETDRERAGNGR